MLIVLDVSGSMINDPIYNAKRGIQKIVNSCLAFLSKAYLITFNHETKVHKLEKKGSIEFIDSIEASGGTDFVPVFKQIRGLLKEFKNNTTVVIFTDGCGSYKQSDIDLLRNDNKRNENQRFYTYNRL